MANISLENQSIAGEPFRIGAALSRAFELFYGAFDKFLLLALISLSPPMIIKVIEGRSLFEPAKMSAANALVIVVSMFLHNVTQAACLYGSYQAMRGESFTIRRSLGVAIARMLPIIGVALAAAVLTSMGMVLLIAPGFIALCAFYVAIPACVIERSGVLASLGRSRALTRGYRWPVFGLLLIVMVFSALIVIPVALASRLGAPLLLAQVIQFCWDMLATAFGAVLVAVVYHDLRVAKEGVDIEKIADVFD